MAVRIEIPEIGTVVADNAASEETLQAILKALDSTAKAKDRGADAAAAAQAENTKQVKAGTKVGKEFNVGWAAAADGAVKALKNISLTAVSMATNFATNFSDIANNPIKETAKMLDTLIDATAKTATSLTDAIPVIGGFISALINAGAELAKAANKTFADQLQKNIDTLQAYNKVGVSFMGGMNQMNVVAHNANMSLVDLSKIVSQNKDTLNKMGLAGGEAAVKLAGAMGVASKETKKGAMTMRDEMFKMGYSYEEQGAIFSSFMANMQVAGKLRAMNDQQVAEQTRKYATDLKVISDLTGQDAKKLAEKSRNEAMRGSLLAELSGDQVTAFQRANEMLTKAGPEVQAALTQYIKFGTITDPKVIANREIAQMVKTIGTEVKKGNKDMVNVTNREMANASKEMLSAQGKAFGSAVDSSLVAGVGGITGDIADVRNRFMAATVGLDPEAAKKSAQANENQATKADQLADNTAKLYAQTKNYEVEMETIVNKHLPKYAELLKDINEELQGNFMKWIKSFREKPTKEQLAEQRKNEQAYQKNISNVQQGFGQENLQRQAWESDEDYRNRIIELSKRLPKHDKGGTIGAGKLGIAGENGPELIGGPGSVLSTASTAKLVEALDAMRELSGNRLGEAGINQRVSMSESRLATLKGRTKGFDGFDYNQLNEEFMKRPESEPIRRAMKQMDDEESGVSSMAETNEHLSTLVKLMRDNVNHTARVAVNTN